MGDCRRRKHDIRTVRIPINKLNDDSEQKNEKTSADPLCPRPDNGHNGMRNYPGNAEKV
jgi:hypothetical protein